MKLQVKKWGNSYGLRIPKELVSSMQLKENTILYASKEQDKLVLQRLSKREILDIILKDAKPQKAIDWGAPRGKEYW